MSDQPNHRTVFFRHLPKTAGTSLTTTLANIYGDGQTHRFRDVGEDFAAMFNGVLAAVWAERQSWQDPCGASHGNHTGNEIWKTPHGRRWWWLPSCDHMQRGP